MEQTREARPAVAAEVPSRKRRGACAQLMSIIMQAAKSFSDACFFFREMPHALCIEAPVFCRGVESSNGKNWA